MQPWKIPFWGIAAEATLVFSAAMAMPATAA
jgi:hypothetical protein